MFAQHEALIRRAANFKVAMIGEKPLAQVAYVSSDNSIAL